MDWLNEHLWEAWLIAAISLGVLEVVSLDLIFAMLAGGALVGTVAALVGGSLWVTVLLALASAVGLLVLLRPALLSSLHSGPELRTGHHGLIGQRATATTEISLDRPGRIKVRGEDWQAIPYDEDDRIEPGTPVEVITIQGVTASVLRVPQLDG